MAIEREGRWAQLCVKKKKKNRAIVPGRIRKKDFAIFQHLFLQQRLQELLITILLKFYCSSTSIYRSVIMIKQLVGFSSVPPLHSL